MEKQFWQLDDAIRKTVKQEPLEKPSDAFTSKVMEKIYTQPSSVIHEAFPAWKIKTWGLITLSVAAVIGFVLVYIPSAFSIINTLVLQTISTRITLLLNGISAAFSQWHFSPIFLVIIAAFVLLGMIDAVLKRVITHA